jgi:hypothetical protein
MTMRMIGSLTGSDYERLKCRQDQIIRGDYAKPRPAPRSRSRNSQALTRAQVEDLRLALLNTFRW